MRCRKGKSVSIGQTQRHLPTLGTGEVVGEEEVERNALIGRQGNRLSVEFHAGIHQRERNPRVGSLDKLAVKLEVDAGSMAT